MNGQAASPQARQGGGLEWREVYHGLAGLVVEVAWGRFSLLNLNAKRQTMMESL